MTPLDYITGYFLDVILGDPQSLPHPVRSIGKLIDWLISRFQKDSQDTFASFVGGIIIWFTTVAATGFSVAFLLSLSGAVGEAVKHLITIYLVYAVLATRCLHVETLKVFDYLEKGNIRRARVALKNVVSRDTENLSEEEILKALLETVSENIVDGIASPLFYLVLGGPIIAWMYKAANTLDSMIGYKTEEFLHLGKFSAKADDVLNFVPARITGCAMVLSSYWLKLDWKRGLSTWLRDASNHASPNAGIPEAVLAGVLQIQLGGRGSYFGKTMDKATLGEPLNRVESKHYKKAIKLLYLSSFTLFFAGFLFIVV